MQLTERELRDTYRRLTARPGHDRSSCFAPAQLVEVVGGALETSILPQARAHLARCSDCSRELLLLRSFGEWAEQEAGELSSVRPAAAVIESRTHPSPMAGGSPANALPLGGSALGPRSWWPSAPGWARGLAVALPVLLLAVVAWSVVLLLQKGRLERDLAEATASRGNASAMEVSLDQASADLADLQSERDGLAATVEELQQTIHRLRQPLLNQPVIPLDLRRVERLGDTLARQEVVVPETASWFTLVVTLPETPNYREYTLEVLDRAAQPVWEGRGVEVEGRGVFRVSFSTDRFRRGIFHLRLFGSDGNSRELVADFSIVLS